MKTLGEYFSTDSLISVKWRIFGWNGFWDTHILEVEYSMNHKEYIQFKYKFDISVHELNNISSV